MSIKMSINRPVNRRVPRTALACLMAATALIVAAESASAQKYNSNGKPNIGVVRQPAVNVVRQPTVNMSGPKFTPKTPRVSGGGGGKTGGGGYDGGGRNDGGGGYQGGGGGYRGPGWGAVVPGIIMAVPAMIPPSGPASGGRFVDDGTVIEDIDRQQGRRAQQPRRNNQQRASNAPPANERRLVPDEVVIELTNAVTPQQIDALQQRHRLTRLETQPMTLTGTTFYRWRIPDRRSVPAVVRALEADNVVASAQPNYLFTLQQDAAKPQGDAAQYELAKLKLPQAHALAKGDNVLVAVIDSAIDTTHPELDGSIADSFDTLTTPLKPHAHGTGIAGLIAAHGRLMGAAPGARLLAIRAFDPKAKGAEGSTFNILKGLDWAVERGARVINMSFAGPTDPVLRRSLEAAAKKGIVLIAAAGNAGAKSPPLYPAADANVIAVTATDADDKLFQASNRGKHIAIAAPGAQLLVPIPDGGYEVSSGTSYSAAGISGIAALILQRKPDTTPAQLRDILMTTAKDLGPKGRDAMFGAGLADAYGALTADEVPVAQATPLPKPLPVERVSAGAR